MGQVESDSDPCVIAADASYRGCENQLYRVEVHQGGAAAAAGGASFKWSRENGSVIFPINGPVAATTAADGSAQLSVSLARFGRDARLGLTVGDWVELVDDDYTLAQRALPLLQVLALDVADCSVTLAVPKDITAYQPSSDSRKHPLLRRWDQSAGLSEQGVVSVTEGAPITLEDNIQVTFAAGGVYATGDYWLIPARVAGNGMLDWPFATAGDVTSGPAALPPRGLHHYAVLGVTSAEDGYEDCCCRLDSLCTLLRADAINAGRQPSAVPAAAKSTGKATKAAKKGGSANVAKSG